MAQISITIPDAVLLRVLAAFASTYGYQASSGLTQAQFAKQQVGKFVQQTVVAYEANAAASTARSDQTAKSTTDIQIT